MDVPGDTIIYLDPLNPEQTLDTALSMFNKKLRVLDIVMVQFL